MLLNISSSPISLRNPHFLSNFSNPISYFPRRSKTHLSKSQFFPNLSALSNQSLKNRVLFGNKRYPDGERIDFRTRAISGIDLGSFESVLEAIAVLTTIIVVHESGHFLAASLQGIHCSETMSDSEASAVVPQPAVTVSPYTLANSDNPGALISSVKLNGENYNEWSEEMLNALQAKRKTGFVNGTIVKPPSDDPNYENWMTVNSMIVGWIRTSMDPKVKSTVTFVSDSHKLWTDLKQRFSVGNEVRVHQIKNQLASCRQEGQTVLDYYGKLCKLWDELQNYRPLPVCSCGAKAEIAKDREKEKLHQFVMGLDDARFGGLCTSLLGTDPLPSLGEAYSKVIREEQRLSSARERDQRQEAVGFVTRQDQTDSCTRVESVASHQNRPESSIIRSRTVVCNHCGRTGHEKKDCWQIVGFPEWFTERNNDRNGGGRGSGNRGRGGRGSGRGRGQFVTAHATSSNPAVLPEFTQDQLRALSQLLQEKSSNGGHDKLSGPFFEDSDWSR